MQSVPNHYSGFTHADVATLQLTLSEAQRKGRYCSSSLLVKELKEKNGVYVTKVTVCKWLQRMGYVWGKGRAVGAMTKETRDKRIRVFINEYAAAFQEEKEGKCTLVYTDESYVHVGHRSSGLWYQPASVRSNEVQRPAGKGKRFIILHAMARAGLLCKRDAQGKPVAASNVMEEVAENAELVFADLKMQEDYHQTMDGKSFMLWVENRLIPSYKSLYPDLPMVLVLGNAPYHHAHEEGWKNPARMKKLELAAWLVEQGLKEIKIKRGGEMKTFGLASLFNTRSKFAPALEEMQAYAKQYLKEHPELSRSRLQKLMDEHGYRLIFTPPYTPQLQPIELLWAYVKNFVARSTSSSSTSESLQQLMRLGFYGDPARNHEGVTPSLCERLIGHCLKWMNEFIAADEDLDGTLEDLSLAGEAKADLWEDMQEAEEEEKEKWEEEREEEGEEEDEEEG